MKFEINQKNINLSNIDDLLSADHKITIASETKSAIQSNRSFLEKKLASSDKPIYGINTGFGSLCDVKISNDELDQLQLNLVRSHACGMGDRVPDNISRLILFLKIKNMSLGYSGVRMDLVDRMLDIYNSGIAPTMYQLGSLGASGDLAPLAHLGLTIIGEDENNATTAFALKEKEGLAILNGTQFSAAYGSWCTIMGEKLYRMANRIAALSLEAFQCDTAPFHSAIHKIRPHAGHADCAAEISRLREQSQISILPKVNVQDPYSFRCIPQVHGASHDTIMHVKSILEKEINSVTDNPLIVEEEDLVLSGGNFHAQPIAMALDYLAIALSELGSISERRIYQLINGHRDLPNFLVEDAGLNSGFMITQYTAASITSQNKQLCTPASADSIISCKGQEDHVSMAANAATKCYRVVNNLKRILSLELLVAAQAMEYRRPHKSSPELESLMNVVRSEVPKYEQDRMMQKDMAKVEAILEKLLNSIKIS